MTRRTEHPVFDRPFEFFSGLFLAVAGIVILASTLILGVPDFAPRYLAKLPTVLTIAYAALTVAGGMCVMVGLYVASRTTSTVLGRGIEAVGHFLMMGIAITYWTDLAWGELQSPRNTLLMAILFGRIFGSMIRCWRLLLLNRQVINALKSVNDSRSN